MDLKWRPSSGSQNPLASILSAVKGRNCRFLNQKRYPPNSEGGANRQMASVIGSQMLLRLVEDLIVIYLYQ
jgi:hypothetical protein